MHDSFITTAIFDSLLCTVLVKETKNDYKGRSSILSWKAVRLIEIDIKNEKVIVSRVIIQLFLATAMIRCLKIDKMSIITPLGWLREILSYMSKTSSTRMFPTVQVWIMSTTFGERLGLINSRLCPYIDYGRACVSKLNFEWHWKGTLILPAVLLSFDIFSRMSYLTKIITIRPISP